MVVLDVAVCSCNDIIVEAHASCVGDECTGAAAGPLHLPTMAALFGSLFPFICFSYADSAHYFLACCVRTAEAFEGSLVSFICIDVKQMHRQHKPTAAREKNEWVWQSVPPSPRPASIGAGLWEGWGSRLGGREGGVCFSGKQRGSILLVIVLSMLTFACLSSEAV